MRTDVDPQMTPPVSRPAKAAATASRRLSYLTVNPIAALAALALTSGGLLVLIFFLRIGFMPDVDLATSTALLFAVALVGLGTVIASMFVAVLPGLVTAYALGEYKIAPDLWTLASVAGGGVLLALVVMTDGWLTGGRLLPWVSWIVWPFLVAALIFVMARVAWLRWRTRQGGTSTSVSFEGGYWQAVFLLSASAFMWLGGLITALQFAAHLARESSHPDWLTGLWMLAWLVVLIGANLSMVRLPLRTALIFAPVVGALLLGVLILLSEGVGGISVHALRRLGLAELEHVDLVVRSDVCKSLRLTSATALRCDGSAGAEAGILRDVVVRSRIGTQLVVEPSTKRDASSPIDSSIRTNRTARLILKKDDVLMWARRD